MSKSALRALFPTLIYEAPLLSRGASAFNAELLVEAYKIRDADGDGQRWCARGGYPLGYTSYASLDQLHRMSSTFATLGRRLDRHARAYADALEWDLRDRALTMTDCWVNIMPPGCAHSFHIHPHAVISGTYYVSTPRGSSPLKFEDPRLSKMMAAPTRRDDASEVMRPFVSAQARAGRLVLFESWLRHEVPAQRADEDRVSISFNYDWR